MQNRIGHLNDDDWDEDADEEEDGQEEMVSVLVGIPLRHYAGLQGGE